MICSSLNLLRFIRPPPIAADSTKIWRRAKGSGHIVSSLHHLPDGAEWHSDAVLRHDGLIRAAGLTWSVVESVPVSTEIKVRGPERLAHLETYRQSIRAVAAAGVKTICYNFIPLVDWMRTEMRHPLRSGLALRFDMVDFAACDMFILKRRHAAASYDTDIVRRAEERFAAMPAARREELESTVLAPLPGGTISYSRGEFERTLERYDGIGEADYRQTLVDFLAEMTPVAEENGIRLVLHPDDPPINLFGLPRIAGSAAQLRAIFDAVPSPANGLTFCVGSLGVREENDLVAMVREFAPRIGFAHLRNVQREADLSFYEAEHIGGSSDMAGVVRALLDEESRRRAAGEADWQIPMRPDHGHLMLDDIAKTGTKPGYSAVGRLKGLAELNGLIAAFEWMDNKDGGARLP
jgi:mannonate dehydratase